MTSSRGSEPELWVCPNCGNEGDIHFDRSLCVCGMMHHFCGCGVQADDCDPEGENPYDTVALLNEARDERIARILSEDESGL